MEEYETYDCSFYYSYMKRRCTFLDNMPAFNYNQCRGEHKKVNGKDIWTDTSKLGSTLMRTMLKEVSDFCDPQMKESWSQQPHQQVSRYLEIGTIA